MAAVFGAIDGAVAVCDMVKSIYPEAEELSKALIETIDNAFTTLAEAKYTQLKQHISLSNAEQSLRNVAEQATPFFYCIGDLYYFTEKEDLESISTAFGNGDPQLLNDFVYRMQQKLSNICEAHQILSDACDAAKRECEEAAIACCECEAKENTKKKFAKVAGGLTTVGVVAGGVTASVAAGVFTMGIGTVVGVTATAASAGATVAVSAGTAGATCYVAAKIGKTEKQFRGFRDKFLIFKSQLFEIDRQAKQAQGQVDNYARNLNSLEYVDKHSYQSLCDTLGRLRDIAKELRPKAKEILTNINACAEKVSNS